jgi:hypothetical protein
MNKRYFVTYAHSYAQTDQRIDSTEITIDVESGDAPGMIAEKLEAELSKQWDDTYIVVINFWQM